MVIDMQLITLRCKSSLVKQSLGVTCLDGHENNFMVSQLNDRFLMTRTGGDHKDCDEEYVEYFVHGGYSLLVQLLMPVVWVNLSVRRLIVYV